MEKDRFQKVVEDAARVRGCTVVDIDFNDDDKLALLKSASKQARDKIKEKGSDLHEYSDWTQESFEKQFKGVAMSAIASTLIGNKEFADSLLKDPEMIDKVASSILADIRLHPDGE